MNKRTGNHNIACHVGHFPLIRGAGLCPLSGPNFLKGKKCLKKFIAEFVKIKKKAVKKRIQISAKILK